VKRENSEWQAENISTDMMDVPTTLETTGGDQMFGWWTVKNR